MPQLFFERTIPLWHGGTCRLLGISPAPFTLYAEEVYGDGNWVAQYAFTREGALLAVADEAHGENPQIAPLPLPDGLKAPTTGWISMALNLGGLPPRGSMHDQRLHQMARPLKTPEKEMLIARGLLPDVPLNTILGIIGSYVTAEARLARNLYWLIRRIRVAIALDEPETADDGSLIDYTSDEFSLLHRYEPSVPDTPLHHTIVDEAELGVLLSSPTDLVLRDDLLVIAEAGAGEPGRVSTLNLWQVEHEIPPTDEERLYGSLDS